MWKHSPEMNNITASITPLKKIIIILFGYHMQLESCSYIPHALLIVSTTFCDMKHSFINLRRVKTRPRLILEKDCTSFLCVKEQTLQKN